MNTQFQSQRLSTPVASISSPSTKTINLLLLGKSGVGKSMFINAFGNYNSYENMNDIKSLNDVKVSVPMAFEMSDDSFNMKQFVIGEKKNMDKNENLKFNAASGTQGCKSYKYKFEDTYINLIDTPGLVDTDGVDKDKENMDAILSFIGQYKYINGICLVLQPDEERLNDVFKYCIHELLCQLDHSAASNIIWIFTKSAATLYRVGSTSRAIKLMIDDIQKTKPEVNIPFEKKNCFLFDSVSFKYLIARDQITFSEDDVETFNESWNRSYRESLRMLHHAVDVKPYDVHASLLIYRARELINGLLPHMEKIIRNIIENEELLRQKTVEIADFEGSVNELKRILFIETIKLKTVHHYGPRIVCKSSRCRKESFVDGKRLVSYPQICYSSDTSLKEWFSQMRDFVSNTGANASTFIGSFGVVGVAAAAATGLAVAAAVLGYSGYWLFKKKCALCSCSNINHSINYYEIHEAKEQIKDPDIEMSLKMAANVAHIKRNFNKQCETRISRLQEEKRVVDEANGTFAVFLKQRAIVPYSDAYPSYLKLLIKDSESIQNGEAKVQRLKETLKNYEELKEKIAHPHLSDSGQDVESVSLLQIDDMVKRLMLLPTYGPEIKKTLQAMKDIHKNYQFNTDKSDRRYERSVSAIF